ncbi:hypothetical protein PR048_032626 [Dryococelus australis]|uniref:Uncharacterized protein n=1 Tax=Dryococelus australis TaxID=614101 RepID=A0ABQ9G2R8_9NEOP|nr:hypothetical protein PR048_032626 [Dryococelus australis]
MADKEDAGCAHACLTDRQTSSRDASVLLLLMTPIAGSVNHEAKLTGSHRSAVNSCSSDGRTRFQGGSAAPEVGEREIPEKTRRSMAFSGTIPTCENPATRPGIEPGSPWWEASSMSIDYSLLARTPDVAPTQGGTRRLREQHQEHWCATTLFYPPISSVGATVAVWLDHSPPTKAIRIKSPAGESCRTMPLVGGFSRGSPVSPALSFRCRSILTSTTLIGSQDLAVKSRPNLFIQYRRLKYLSRYTEKNRDEVLGET